MPVNVLKDFDINYIMIQAAKPDSSETDGDSDTEPPSFIVQAMTKENRRYERPPPEL